MVILGLMFSVIKKVASPWRWLQTCRVTLTLGRLSPTKLLGLTETHLPLCRPPTVISISGPENFTVMVTLTECIEFPRLRSTRTPLRQLLVDLRTPTGKVFP